MIKQLIAKIQYKMECVRSGRRKKQENRRMHNTICYDVTGKKLNKVIGLACIVYGAVTIAIPTGSIWAISLGLFLFACPFSIWSLLKRLGSDIKYYVGVRI